MAEQEAIGLLVARDFNVLQQIARREFPDRRDLTADRARTALPRHAGAQAQEPGEERGGGAGPAAPGGPGGLLAEHAAPTGLVVTDVFTREGAAQQAVGHGDAGGREGGRELRGDDGPGERVPGTRGPCRSRRCTGRSCRATGTPRR